jgi:DNA-binding PadR family transcriptional regulator
MINQEKYELSHVSFVTLGLIAEKPSHAKEIDDRIEERGMRNWTAIGTSSIYGVLKILKKDGLIISWIEELDNRIIKVYQVTDFGLNVLKDKVFNVISDFVGKNDPDFYVAFSMLPLLTQDQQIKVITSALAKIKTHKKELEKMLEENSHLPLNVVGLFIHPIKILETDIEFLTFVLEEVKEGKGQVDPEAYSK